MMGESTLITKCCTKVKNSYCHPQEGRQDLPARIMRVPTSVGQSTAPFSSRGLTEVTCYQLPPTETGGEG